MGYFPNGTAGMMFQEMYCDRCIHDKEFRETGEGSGCAVWMVHLLHNYDALDNGNELARAILDELIQTPIDGEHRCSMFVEEAAS